MFGLFKKGGRKTQRRSKKNKKSRKYKGGGDGFRNGGNAQATLTSRRL
jgi:hypothetical protein